jgi:hypothetical protein
MSMPEPFCSSYKNNPNPRISHMKTNMKTTLYSAMRSCTFLLCGCAVMHVLPALAFNDDGITDIVWRNVSSGANEFWIMEEVKWRPDYVTYSTTIQTLAENEPGWNIVGTADFNRDGHTDLLWRHDDGSKAVRIWLMSGSTVTGTVNVAHASSDWYVVGTGDFNGDGYADIVWRNDEHNLNAVWFMEEARYVNSAYLTPSGTSAGWRLVAVGDFNNDNHPDIFLHNSVYGLLGIWYMNGTQMISSTALMHNGGYLYPEGWTPAGTGFFNMTGNCDLLWRHPNGSTAVWLMRNAEFLRGLMILPSRDSSTWQIGGTGGYINRYSTFEARGRQSSAIINSPQITLQWRLGDSQRLSIYRRPYGSSNWGSALDADLLTCRWSDPEGPPVGQRWEYQLASGGSETTIATAIEDPALHERGTVILVVEAAIASEIEASLNLFKLNLIGDGWKVRRVPDVPSHDDAYWLANRQNVVNVRNAIKNVYLSNPDSKAVILIGHVPIPHSGFASPDAHGVRSLPADTFYGDMDWDWTVADTDDIGCNLSSDCECDVSGRHRNRPGDGIFDYFMIPSALELAVGRIDFGNMQASLEPIFGPNYEVQALLRYLDKNDRYRRGQVPLQERVMLGTYFHGLNQNQRVLNSGLRLGGHLFGFAPEKVINGDGFWPWNGCTWAVLGGYGQRHHVGGSNAVFHATYIPQGATSDRNILLPGNEPQAGFFVLHGSCFMDFGYADNLMRGILAASTSYNLGVMWGAYHQLRFDTVALGDTVGSGFLRTVNENQHTYLAWIGDPTLRVQILAPPTNLSAGRNGNYVSLTWTASPEATQYHVYRSSSGLDGTWTRITSSAISGTSFTDTSAPPSQGVTYQYQVRAMKLKTTSSGSFNNLSQAAFSNPVS